MSRIVSKARNFIHKEFEDTGKLTSIYDILQPFWSWRSSSRNVDRGLDDILRSKEGIRTGIRNLTRKIGETCAEQIAISRGENKLQQFLHKKIQHKEILDDETKLLDEIAKYLEYAGVDRIPRSLWTLTTFIIDKVTNYALYLAGWSHLSSASIIYGYKFSELVKGTIHINSLCLPGVARILSKFLKEFYKHVPINVTTLPLFVYSVIDALSSNPRLYSIPVSKNAQLTDYIDALFEFPDAIKLLASEEEKKILLDIGNISLAKFSERYTGEVFPEVSEYIESDKYLRSNYDKLKKARDPITVYLKNIPGIDKSIKSYCRGLLSRIKRVYDNPKSHCIRNDFRLPFIKPMIDKYRKGLMERAEEHNSVITPYYA
jgi:hypothetical protein